MAAFLEVLEIVGCVLFVIVFLGFCIFIHELGHFLTAKMCGLHVNAFSIGFKKAWGKKINGVDYRIGWLPFGGYVDIPQIDSTTVPHTEEGKELPPAKPIHRLLSAFMGPFFNILFGLALGCVVWYFGVPQVSPKMKEMEVVSIDKAGPEYQAGLRKGDKIIKINDEKFNCTWDKFIRKILFTIGDVKLDVKRDGKTLKITYKPKLNPNAPERMKFEKLPWPYFKVKIPIMLYPKKDSPAAKAGMQDGDMVVSINGKTGIDKDDFWGMINYSKGKDLNLVVRRKGKDVKLAPIKPELHPTANLKDKGKFLIGVFFSPTLKILAVVYDSPASRAGIKPNDRIIDIKGVKVKDDKAFKTVLKALKDKPFEMTIKRKDKEIKLKLAAEPPPKVYSIGVDTLILSHPTPVQQFVNVIDMSYRSLKGLTVNLLNFLHITEQKSSIKIRNLSGPIGLATTLYESVKVGTFRYGLYFVVLVSFALAIFNLLPLPVLDGGHMLFALIEIIIRKPVHEGTIKVLTFVFIFLLITLMVFVTYFDILRRMSKDMQEKFDPQSDIYKKIQKENAKSAPAGKEDVKAAAVPTN